MHFLFSFLFVLYLHLAHKPHWSHLSELLWLFRTNLSLLLLSVSFLTVPPDRFWFLNFCFLLWFGFLSCRCPFFYSFYGKGVWMVNSPNTFFSLEDHIYFLQRGIITLLAGSLIYILIQCPLGLLSISQARNSGFDFLIHFNSMRIPFCVLSIILLHPIFLRDWRTRQVHISAQVTIRLALNVLDNIAMQEHFSF